MLDTYQEPAIGFQANSLRKTGSLVSLPKGTREQRELVYISRAHDKLSPNKDSPGPIYDIPSTVGRSRVAKFGTGPQRYVTKPQSVESSTDLLDVTPDSQKFRYPGVKGVNFGSDSRDVIKNATILKNHPQAFFGTQSPGPALYTLPAKRDGPLITIATRTKPLGTVCQTPAGVGPGSYAPSSSLLPHACSFPKSKQRPDNDCPDGRCSGLYNPAVAVSLGPQPNSLKRSAPHAVLGTQTREQWRKIALERSAVMKIRIPHPTLPTRMDSINWSSCQ